MVQLNDNILTNQSQQALLWSLFNIEASCPGVNVFDMNSVGF